MEIAFSLGSNLGDRRYYLSEAARRILEVPGTELRARSSLYETEPVGVKPAYQGLAFMNAVLVVESPDAAPAWLERIHRLEEDLGRVRGADRYAPRTVDIDILYRGEEVIGRGGLTVPHPRWAQRRFVLAPLAEVRPDLVLPGEALAVRAVLDALPPGEDAVRLEETW